MVALTSLYIVTMMRMVINKQKQFVSDSHLCGDRIAPFTGINEKIYGGNYYGTTRTSKTCYEKCQHSKN